MPSSFSSSEPHHSPYECRVTSEAVVAVALPNGAEMGVAVLSTMACAVCAPLNVDLTPEELLKDMQDLGAEVVLVAAGEGAKFGGTGEGTPVQVLELHADVDVCGLFRLSGQVKGVPRPSEDEIFHRDRDDRVLLLQTSGTSGKKKTVPYTLDTLVVGATCVIASWGLGPSDVCFNMMPLFHTGGIVRNLLSPILAGGATILAPGFDAGLFWDAGPRLGVTWYYGAPTMHQMLLAEAARRGDHRRARLRLVGNAAGPLLPSLAQALKSTFWGATVLPSYGMTECMPISSPPQSYQLDRVGTSGRSVGPQLAIVDEKGREVSRGQIGRIAVQGPPNFHGYEGVEDSVNERLPGGWFDTGDLGYMDTEGYLFITGRSKDVINRGGEIISPVEVEDAVVSHPRIEAAMAFSVAHDVLQEVVAVGVVMKAGCGRVGLAQLQQHVAGTLHPSKWPQDIIYMDRLPLTVTKKLQRVGMAGRLGLPEIADSTSAQQRLFEATCPPGHSSPQQPVPCTPVSLDSELARVAQELMKDARVSDAAAVQMPNGIVAFVVLSGPQGKNGSDTVFLKAILDSAQPPLHDYAQPEHFVTIPKISRTTSGAVDDAWLTANAPAACVYVAPRNDAETRVQWVFAEILGLPQDEVSVLGDFFLLGGDSLRAGRCIAALRKEFGVELKVGDLYQRRTPERLAEHLGPAGSAAGAAAPGRVIAGYAPPEHLCTARSNTSAAALVLQALPVVVAWPVKRICTWYFFAWVLGCLRQSIEYSGGPGGVIIGALLLILSLYITIAARAIAAPLLGLAVKWLIVGRTRPGAYPLWGSYYLRRMLSHHLLAIGGRGVFEWHSALLPWYYRLGGAKIGKGVSIHPKAILSDFDLVTIGDGACIDAALVRPFRLATGTMLLQPLSIGTGARVCLKSAVAPGSAVPDDAVLGPLSSTHELGAEEAKANNKFASCCRPLLPNPNFASVALMGWPIIILCKVFAAIPPLLGLVGLVAAFNGHVGSREGLADTLRWFANPKRFGWYILIRIARAVFTPMFNLAAVIVVKKLVIGKFKPGPRDMSQWGLLRHWLMAKLLPGGDLGKVAPLVGRNLELVSCIYRAMGAKIGKRVWWPGSGLDMVEYDLLEIGDDVVFGSRSAVITTDTEESQRVVIGNGAMVADRCVLLPGTRVGRNAVLGSGTLAPKGFDAPGGSVWLGSSGGEATLWQAGDPATADADTTTPYGRAMHLGEADYRVWPLGLHVVMASCLVAMKAVFWLLPLLAVLAVTFQGWDELPPGGLSNPAALGCLIFSSIVAYPFAAVAALGIVIATKWIIIGQREEGDYDWDKSAYNQCWLLHRAIQTINKAPVVGDILERLGGSIYVVWFFRLMGADIGKNVCLYPNGADPPMTEPDLVTIQDNACVDDASLVCHINSRGEFKLNKLFVGDGAVLCAHTRLLSGAAMSERSTLLEHTLVVGGDIVPEGSTFQGWPAEMLFQQQPKTDAKPEVSEVRIDISADRQKPSEEE
ncbi:probable peroxisomal-coenzyme A synthetase at N-terminal half [Coccomyxa sp. Obi]|nr:probable peroxisomal-coenzyme A synthetase at N-terminal half [Coccomyxa sp. Obi]